MYTHFIGKLEDSLWKLNEVFTIVFVIADSVRRPKLTHYTFISA